MLLSWVVIAVLAFARVCEGQDEGGPRQARPRVVTRPQDFEAPVGGSVTLPCDIRNPGRRSVYWFKGASAEQRDVIMQMKSVRGKFMVPKQFQRLIRMGKLETDNSNLVIHNLGVEDSDTYTCSIAVAGQTVSHTVNVLGGRQAAPQLVLTPLPTDGRAVIQSRDDVTLTCLARGDPEPHISWTREGSDRVIGAGPTLALRDVMWNKDGRYTCRAENGVAPPVTFTFNVIIQAVHAEVRDDFILADSDRRVAEFECYIRGYPQPQMKWVSWRGDVEESEHIRSWYNPDTGAHMLQFTDLTPDDMGHYQCYVFNDQTDNSKVLRLWAYPGRPRDITAYPTSPNELVLTWILDSLVPIKNYIVTYEMVPPSPQVVAKEDTGTQYLPAEPAVDGQTYYQVSTTIAYLKPGATYQIKIIAENEDGNQSPNPGPTFVTMPEGGTYVMPRVEDGGETGNTTSSQDSWKWWKLSLTALSRLPQLARVMLD